MKRMVLISALVITQGCNSSDDTAPYIDADSTFSCKDVNLSQFHNDIGKALRMIDTETLQLKSAYKEDTSIQTFFREAATKNTAYYLLLRQKTIEACAANPGLSLSHALTDGLNALYKESLKDMRLATCRSFDEEFDNAQILQEMQHPSKQPPLGDTIALGVIPVLEDKRYGVAYFEKRVKNHCKEKPSERIWDAYSLVAESAMKVISSERLAAQNLEEAKEAAEKARAKDELNKDNLRKYGHNLYQSGEPDCKGLREQYELSIYGEENLDIFPQAFYDTVHSIPRLSKPYQQEAFEEQLESRYKNTARLLAYNCSTTIEDAILSIPEVMDSVSPIISELKSLALGPRGGQAAELALKNAIECEKETENLNLICPDNAEDFLNYNLAPFLIEDLENTLERLEAERKNKPNDFELGSYGQDCKQRLIDQGLRDKEYDNAVQEQCISEALDEYFSPLDKEIDATRKSIALNRPGYRGGCFV